LIYGTWGLIVAPLVACGLIYFCSLSNTVDWLHFIFLSTHWSVLLTLSLCLKEIRKIFDEIKESGEKRVKEKQQIEEFYKLSLENYIKVLRIDFEHQNSLKQLTSIYTKLCFLSQDDQQKALNYLQEALVFAPENSNIHYNLGYIYQLVNRLDLSLVHYKLSIELTKSKSKYDPKKNSPERESNKQLILNCYNGIGCIYRSIKQWPEALHYSLKAHKIDPNDPDINNQLGVVYTEMRRTDLAEICYNKAIRHYKSAFISTNLKDLLCNIYLNLGCMHSYNGDNEKAIENYNKALEVDPKFMLAFQNKIMNLTYCFDQLENREYILQQHKLINKLIPKANKYVFSKDYFQTEKIKVGIVSGDFSNHPVSYFISTLLQNFDDTKYELTCDSECIIDTELYNSKLKFKYVKNMSAERAAEMIHNDNIHILLDLAGHTAFNRLDVFALKPCPIQISYIGYPYSTGLTEMDYSITDDVCDNIEVSQKFYTEKLLTLPGGFLCYDPTVLSRTKKFISPNLQHCPFIKNKYITIGCFNRVNKITDTNIQYFNDILVKNKNVRFVFKTKALLNKKIQEKFLSKFDKENRQRISIFPCTILHEAHLEEYNKIDIAIDTFPYSGTTTSCESLFMGVPVYTVYDDKYYFHAQNVTASILKNSDKEFEKYILYNKNDIHEKLLQLENQEMSFWENLKTTTRSQFMNGNFCNKTRYITEIEKLFANLINNEKTKFK
jgi:predicted O-linked N-acetylglucosamine transferase (SPINDLY family)